MKISGYVHSSDRACREKLCVSRVQIAAALNRGGCSAYLPPVFTFSQLKKEEDADRKQWGKAAQSQTGELATFPLISPHFLIHIPAGLCKQRAGVWLT